MRLQKTLLVLSVFFLTFGYAQEQERELENPYSINVGVNFIDSSGNQNPFFIFGSNNKTAFKNPFEVGFSYRLSYKVGLYSNLSFNKLSNDIVIDGVEAGKDFNYTSFDVGARYYFHNWEISETSIWNSIFMVV